MRGSFDAVLALAAKDLKLTLRNRGALFFAFGWPVLMALFFGFLFGGSGERGRIPVAAVDEDGTPEAALLIDRLRNTQGLELTLASRGDGERLVREGKRSAAVVIPKGYGEASHRLFHGEPSRLEIDVDPSRKAEAAMLEGILTGAAMRSIQDLFSDAERSRAAVDRALVDLRAAPDGEGRRSTERFLGELRAYLDRGPVASPRGRDGAGWQPIVIDKRELDAPRDRPRSAFDFTFPQGVLWGVIGSSLGFALSLVTERTQGTLTRLRMSPLSRGHVLAGKALACFATILAVEAMLLGLGAIAFGVWPASWWLLSAAAVSVAVCFVGLMMVVAVLGRTEQSAGGLGWAIMMPLAMVGGAMVPLFVMPAWMQMAGNLSPVKWGILALEGATWRGFGPSEMALPCVVLLGVGAVGFAIGVRLFGADSAD